MSQKLAIDGFAFARDGRVLEGTLAVASLGRLHDLLAEVSGHIRFRLEGLRGERGQPLLELAVSGVVPLACQRCLGLIEFPIEVESLLELVPAGVEMSQDELEDDSRDFLPVAGDLVVADLVEEEILLALPVAPRHGKCALPGSAEAGERILPFADLAGLKGKPN
ncbi:MAG TPA: YceD family protein [Rhodocyclaceae bacterium]|jgi:uncharacterized protein|nr:DUF177 domain-containing protein [Betaproteobacteria bacterium]HMU99468.1 YceD family protein [Rhodocyclaceae bacterium]HMV20790.1 YceD family protein [Rhodocyclaceae bacterium]HNE42548.1 YceD family protein [Rhodocyclaceae bacterium]HNM21955.1 YceD family protein [Rhodocyclaceae bacterium]